MARNRMIKPQFWEDPTLAQMSRDARLLFIGIWNYCDDYGVVPANPLFLKNRIFPYDEVDLLTIKKWLAELHDLGRIVAVEYKKTAYYVVPNFLKHQKINRPNLKDISIPKSILKQLVVEFIDDENEITDDSLNDHGQITDDSVTLHQNMQRQIEIEEEIEIKKEIKEKEKRSSAFAPPSHEEVNSFFLDKIPETSWSMEKCDKEANKFINFYDSKNWHVGRNKMSKWKSAAAGWISRENELTHGKSINKTSPANNRPVASSGKTFGKL